jgi:fructosamine-3-kinase
VGRRAVFEKSKSGVHPDFYPAEAAGLRWLGAAGAPVVDVLEVDSAHIVLAQVPSGRASAKAARELGAALARMHDAGVDGEQFGCPPAGFDGQIFIGKRPMSSTRHANWGEFYAAERVLPFARIAVEAGSVRPDEFDDLQRACDVIADGAFDDGEPPSRIHGDLWNGNVLWSPDGAVIIDPAAHGGHRETDLAMLDLFGCPYLEAVLESYGAEHPLRDGWRARIPLHQLHPLAVHAAGYGRSYGIELHRAAQALRARAR